MSTLTCDDVMERLGELVDGALEEAEAASLGRHLASCAACRHELEAERELRAATRALPGSVAPARDLWPDIADRIEAGRVVRGRFGWPPALPVRRLATAAAAAVVLAAAVTAAYLAGLNRAALPVADAGPSGPQTGVTPAQLVIGGDLTTIRNDLRARLEERRDELSPETWSVVTENLEVIDRAIQRIQLALEEHPYDNRLNSHLVAAYRLEIDLLQRATRLPAEI
ncbi:MAG TPA: zf-HC2 domain-containing protein [Methylomirabilota bacterium]|nr:zf-HC2 domain-containing protein [Methylomirabilota bacterium]